MGAETVYRVRVLVSHEESFDVAAVTKDEAMSEAARMPGVISVLGAVHYSEICANCDMPLPGGCNGVFKKDGPACRYDGDKQP